MVDCSGRCAFLVVLAVAAAALSGLGCPSTRQLAVSTTSHDFGLSEAPWTFKVWNADTSGSILNFDLATNVSWITCTPTSGASTGPADRETITVTVDRTGLAVGEHRGVITISGRGALYAQVIIYATLADDIAVSHTSYDFEESQLPWAF
ncbi:MAG TPA: hypothetical protein HPP77_04695, partial [Candidatus Hydrogenedentes bacterium]|nr:hypothetical protein [Candidatus Hydrogenedentota bacterium]